jgi:hypothetical protein
MTNRRLPEDLKQLLDLIHKGRLFSLQDWLKSGKPIPVTEGPGMNLRPLEEAIHASEHAHGIIAKLNRAQIKDRKAKVKVA